MQTAELLQQIAALPHNLQEEVATFVTFLYFKEQKDVVANRPKPIFGALKGQIKMRSDFDEPLDDFKEYM